jgi:hypothetical protein
VIGLFNGLNREGCISQKRRGGGFTGVLSKLVNTLFPRFIEKIQKEEEL